MMTCDALRNRLLIEPDPTRVPAELRPHLEGCPGCREFLARFESLAKQLAALPAPPSDLAKIAFLDSLTNAGPIIKSVPSLAPSIASGFNFKLAFQAVAKPLAITAATVAVAAGIWFGVPSKRVSHTPEVARHELLKKVVASNAELAKTSDPKARIATLSDLALNLRSETKDVLNAAQEDDLASLAGMFEDVVNKGLVSQAKQLNPLTIPPATRLEVLTEAANKLAVAADDANELSLKAPPQAKTALKRISTAATQGRIQLMRIASGEGA